MWSIYLGDSVVDDLRTITTKDMLGTAGLPEACASLRAHSMAEIL